MEQRLSRDFDLHYDELYDTAIFFWRCLYNESPAFLQRHLSWQRNVDFWSFSHSCGCSLFLIPSCAYREEKASWSCVFFCDDQRNEQGPISVLYYIIMFAVRSVKSAGDVVLER